MASKDPTHTISVTREHIANGKPNSGDSCPIALALSETYDNALHVNLDSVYMSERSHRTRLERYADTGDCVRQFIRSFDAGNTDLNPIEIGIYERDKPSDLTGASRYMEVIAYAQENTD